MELCGRWNLQEIYHMKWNTALSCSGRTNRRPLPPPHGHGPSRGREDFQVDGWRIANVGLTKAERKGWKMRRDARAERRDDPKCWGSRIISVLACLRKEATNHFWLVAQGAVEPHATTNCIFCLIWLSVVPLSSDLTNTPLNVHFHKKKKVVMSRVRPKCKRKVSKLCKFVAWFPALETYLQSNSTSGLRNMTHWPQTYGFFFII